MTEDVRQDRVKMVDAGEDPRLDPSDYDDYAFWDGIEGTDRRGHPVTSLGGSESRSGFWQFVLDERDGVREVGE